MTTRLLSTHRKHQSYLYLVQALVASSSFGRSSFALPLAALLTVSAQRTAYLVLDSDETTGPLVTKVWSDLDCLVMA